MPGKLQPPFFRYSEENIPLSKTKRADGVNTTVVLPLAEFNGKVLIDGSKVEMTISPAI